MAEQIADLQSECGLSTSVQEFKEQYRFGLVEAVFEWARGMPFSEITNLTDVQEGRAYDVLCLSRTLYLGQQGPDTHVSYCYILHL